jgi:hypothetical protein
MYITKIDDFFYELLDKLNDYLQKNNVFDKITKDTNFVKYQTEILNILKDFISKNVSKKSIIDIIKNEQYYESLVDVIKRYSAYYIYLGLGYHYKGGRDLFITNIIESSKNQKDATFQIQNFYNSENNSKLIYLFNDIKNILKLYEEGKSYDKFIILLQNNLVKYNSTINLVNELGKETIESFLMKDNFHNIIKTLILRQIYKKEDRENIIKELNEADK